MSPESSKADRMTDGKGRAMFDVPALAERWNVSERSVIRMKNSGRIPRPIKLLSMLRWPISVIEQWESDGCPNCRNVVKRGRR